ncbi:MAG: putative 4-mercaptohistidine N1-methyltransferase [Verrucomicrobiae bacterium]|nr:putative 4-mercaptohistidine N1-methyltransferase [Verrucomicrobiae bacterium]NNJ43675.1 putative 4-mercaptohistidine N1-methyltransferase [Akkermansiaceae bacterium]
MQTTYESDQLLSEYLLMHYGTEQQLMPWGFGPKEAIGFPVRTVSHFPGGTCQRALDLGCAVGRSSFELSKNADSVTGVDFSANFIAAANHLRTVGSLDYPLRETGHQITTATASLPTGSHPEICQFLQGDAMHLPNNLGRFDRVHAANLICRLTEPEKLLRRLPELVRPGGHLVLATPCTWLDAFTPRDCQPAGDTFDWLISQLTPAFDLQRQCDEPFLIRETARKFQWTVSLVTLWERRAH